MSEDLGTEEVPNGVNEITSDAPSKEGTPQTMPGLQDHKLDQPPYRSICDHPGYELF